jgi:hypothetical protein
MGWSIQRPLVTHQYPELNFGCLHRQERMDRIKRLRWQQRSLPEDIKQNLSQAEIEVRNMLGAAGIACETIPASGHSHTSLWRASGALAWIREWVPRQTLEAASTHPDWMRSSLRKVDLLMSAC